jgi:DNA-binding transcriptional regulator/RsmH inhibitor MraZ
MFKSFEQLTETEMRVVYNQWKEMKAQRAKHLNTAKLRRERERVLIARAKELGLDKEIGEVDDMELGESV